MANHFDWILQRPGLNHVAIKIFESLDMNSLDNSLGVSKQWFEFIKETESIWKPHISQDHIFHKVCSSGYLNIVKLLIDLGFDINASDEKGETPLIIACQKSNVGFANSQKLM